LATHLSNDLDAIEASFVRACDDYHTIRDPVIHELVNLLLERHPIPFNSS